MYLVCFAFCKIFTLFALEHYCTETTNCWNISVDFWNYDNLIVNCLFNWHIYYLIGIYECNITVINLPKSEVKTLRWADGGKDGMLENICQLSQVILYKTFYIAWELICQRKNGQNTRRNCDSGFFCSSHFMFYVLVCLFYPWFFFFYRTIPFTYMYLHNWKLFVLNWQM